MNKTTLEEAARLIAPGLGRSYPRHNTELYAAVNDLRSFLFASPDFSPLFQDTHQLIRLSSFRPPNQPPFCGFSLFYGAASVLQAWSYGGQNHVRGAFRANFMGTVPTGQEVGGLVELPGTYPVERDVIGASKLYFKSSDPRDAGVQCRVAGVTGMGKHMSVTLALNEEAFGVTADNFCGITEVALGKHYGVITLSCECGEGSYDLSYYDPAETAPSYRRYAAGASCGIGCTLLLRLSMEYTMLTRPLDIVEFSDPAFLHAGGRYIRFKDATAPNERQIAQEAMAQLKGLATGMRARHSAGATKQEFRPTVFNRPQLPSRKGHIHLR